MYCMIPTGWHSGKVKAKQILKRLVVVRVGEGGGWMNTWTVEDISGTLCDRTVLAVGQQKRALRATVSLGDFVSV